MSAVVALLAVLWVVELERVDAPTASHEWISGDATEVTSLRGKGGELPISVSVKTVEEKGERVCVSSVVNKTKDFRVKCLNVRPFSRDVPLQFEGVYCPCGLGVRFPKLPAATDGDVSCGWERVGGIDRKKVYTYHCDWPVFPGNYPGYRATMAYTVLAGATNGIYWACHDSAFKAKCMRPLYDPVKRRMTFSVDFHANVMPGATWRSAPVVEMSYRGRWHVAAKRYRKWFDSVVRLPKQRISDGMTGQLLCILKQQNGEIIWPYGELDKLADVALSHGLDWVGLFGWTEGGHDHLYPDYEPDPAQGGETALREGIRHLHSKGLRCFLYANGQLIEQGTTEFWNGIGKTCGIVKPDGKKYTQTWHKYANTPPHNFDLGCLSGEAWYSRMLSVARRVQALGADGLLYDQLANSQPRPCYSAEHGHAPGDMAFADDKTRFLRRLRDELAKVDPDFILASEGLGDSLSDTLAFCHGMSAGAHPYDKCFEMIRRRFRGEDVAEAEVYPEFFRYTFPEVVSTCRVPSPILTRDYVNYDCIFGLRHEIEIRYSPDRRYVETGKMPDVRDYGPVLGPPDLKLMAAENQRTARDYLRRVCDFQRRFSQYFLRGTYCDDEGVVLSEGGFAAKRLKAADGTSAVLVWNPGDSPQIPHFVKPGKPDSAFSPENGVETVTAPVPPNALRLYVFPDKQTLGPEVADVQSFE